MNAQGHFFPEAPLVKQGGLFALVGFLGAIVAFFGPIAGLAEMVVVGVFLFILTLQFSTFNGRNWVFWLAFVLPLLLALVLKITGVSLFGAWQALLLLFALFGVQEFVNSVRQERLLQWFVAVFLMFLGFAVASTLTGRSHMYSAAYQLFSDFKPLLALILGYALCWNLRMEQTLWLVIRWFWLPAILLVFLEWLSPSLYFKVFPGGVGRLSPDPSGVFPSRALGMFEHPSFLATTSATFFVLSVSRGVMEPTAQRQSWCLATVYFLLVVFAVQRQELAACLIAAFLVFLLARPERFVVRMMVVTILSMIATIVFWSVFEKNITREAALWGIGTVGAIEHPRAQIFTSAWQLANSYFPLGSGLGTFAGAGAEKFDTSLYEDLGFRRYWWFGREDFLMDTYWPNSIAESGFFGAISLLLSYLLLTLYALQRSLKSLPSLRHYWACAAALMVYMLLLSISSPAFQDLRLFIVPALLFGIATRASQRSQS